MYFRRKYSTRKIEHNSTMEILNSVIISLTKAKPLRNLDYIDFLLYYQIIMDFFKLTCMVDRLEMGKEKPCCLLFELLL